MAILIPVDLWSCLNEELAYSAMGIEEKWQMRI